MQKKAIGTSAAAGVMTASVFARFGNSPARTAALPGSSASRTRKHEPIGAEADVRLPMAKQELLEYSLLDHSNFEIAEMLHLTEGV